MTGMPVLRRATPEDVPQLKELGVLGWETTYHTYVCPANRAAYLAGPFWSLQRLEALTRDARCLALVAEDNTGRVTGFITLEPASERRVELTRLYVDPTRQRSGISTTLYDAGLAWARGTGAPSMLANVFAENDAGRRFYERAGFVLTDLSPTQVGDQTVADACYELPLDDRGLSA
jgi:L-amino acid N-acyltransferase YncA